VPAEEGVEKHALQEVEIGVASAAGANIVSIYVYFTESLLSGEPPTLGLAGAGKFFLPHTRAYYFLHFDFALHCFFCLRK
jgi:hypothetical protein